MSVIYAKKKEILILEISMQKFIIEVRLLVKATSLISHTSISQILALEFIICPVFGIDIDIFLLKLKIVL